ncbi:MAG: hypothetical protein HQL88_02710 [Magnetococcales bacterium]|nr:hypothetical protein [Magnetococcales bacterium]
MATICSGSSGLGWLWVNRDGIRGMSRHGIREKTESLIQLLAPLLVAVPALAILLWTFYVTSEQLGRWAESSLGKIGDQIIEKTENFLFSASFSADFNAAWIARAADTEHFSSDFHQIAYQQMGHFPQFRLIYFGDQQGNHWLNKRDPDGVVRTRLIRRLDDSPRSRTQLVEAEALSEIQPEERVQRQKLLAPLLHTAWYERDEGGELRFSFQDTVKIYDPRLRPWYAGAQRAQGKSWIDVYTWENKFQDKITHEAGITVSYPVVRKGQLLGVVGIDLVLGAISDFLSRLQISAQGRAFIFDSLGQVVGMPHQNRLLLDSQESQGTVTRLRLQDLDDPTPAAAYEALRTHLQSSEKSQSGSLLGQFAAHVLHFSWQERRFLAFFRPLDPAFQLDWYVGVLMPEEEITGDVEQQFRQVFIGIVIVVILLLSLIPLHIKTEKNRRWIRAAFAKYVSPNRVAYLLKNPDHLTLGGEYRECSFVMTDLKGFTAMMEQCGEANPEQLVHILNDYLEGMVGIAFRHEGTLDRIVGDAVAVLFSAPLPQADHAERAVACALEMDRFAFAFALQQQSLGVPFGHTRIGVHSGRVLLGNFGGKEVFDYRALGDPINTASRLESVNNQLGTRVCISGETLSRLSGFRGRPVGCLVLKGKEKGIEAYQPLTEAEFFSPQMQAYEAAYRLMAQEDPSALASFAQALEQWPEDPLLQFHHRRLSSGERGKVIYFVDK